MDVITHYDNLICEDNDPFRDSEPLKNYMDKWDGQIFVDSMKLAQDKCVLEIGIGTGRIAAKVAPLCLSLYGIDITSKTVERAKENLSAYNNVNLICADFLEFDFGRTFDVIYSSLTMMHFKDKQSAINKVSQLLKHNGVFCLSIDMNADRYIDMGKYKLEIFPDSIENITSFISLTDMKITHQYDTEFAHIFVCIKDV